MGYATAVAQPAKKLDEGFEIPKGQITNLHIEGNWLSFEPGAPMKSDRHHHGRNFYQFFYMPQGRWGTIHLAKGVLAACFRGSVGTALLLQTIGDFDSVLALVQPGRFNSEAEAWKYEALLVLGGILKSEYVVPPEPALGGKITTIVPGYTRPGTVIHLTQFDSIDADGYTNTSVAVIIDSQHHTGSALEGQVSLYTYYHLGPSRSIHVRFADVTRVKTLPGQNSEYNAVRLSSDTKSLDVFDVPFCLRDHIVPVLRALCPNLK